MKIFDQQNFSGVPKYLGQVDGKDVLSYIEGDVPTKFRPWPNEQVMAAACLLRGMHDATRGSELAGRFDVVCHHDPGPNNYVFRDGVPVALIDFEQAAPGGRLEDVSYFAWTWSITSWYYSRRSWNNDRNRSRTVALPGGAPRWGWTIP